ncbi:MAG: hypothetical protein IJN48_00345, partial [Clostridia bacterium]|nr:hypothetical protein [Clostridia bacterium]
ENKVVMALVFQCTGTAYTADELVFKGSYTDVYGTERTFTVSGDKIDVSDSGVTVDVDAVWAKDLRQMITGALYLTDGTQVSDSVEFSVECYANHVFKDSAAADNLKNVCAAILEYSDAAKALFCDDTDYSAQ